MGLKNQGATSIIQTLFHIPVFRELIFVIPSDITIPKSKNQRINQKESVKNENEIFYFHCHSHQRMTNENEKQILLNLQILFTRIQTSNESVSTQVLMNLQIVK